MEAMLKQMEQLLASMLPKAVFGVEEPAHAGGSHWVDVILGKKRLTLEYRPGRGFGLFHDDAGYGERPAEIYRTPQRAAQRIAQLMAPGNGKIRRVGFKKLRELYGYSQVTVAKKAGVKQPAISRFEKRGEVKFGTLEAAIHALGGRLEMRAHFPDADIPISLSKIKN